MAQTIPTAPVEAAFQPAARRGGGLIPLAVGALADAVGLNLALTALAACHLWIATYGLLGASGGLRPPAAQAV